MCDTAFYTRRLTIIRESPEAQEVSERESSEHKSPLKGGPLDVEVLSLSIETHSPLHGSNSQQLHYPLAVAA